MTFLLEERGRTFKFVSFHFQVVDILSFTFAAQQFQKIEIIMTLWMTVLRDGEHLSTCKAEKELLNNNFRV
jgi:hypothetical protein